MLYTIGPQVFDPQRRTLARGEAVVELGQKASDLLLALLEAAGETVTKAALLDRAWPETAVEEGNLTVQIAALRKLLGKDSAGRDLIVTVPRLGYRLVLGEAAPAIEATPPIVGVARFVNLGGDPAEDYFADGIVDDIAAALSRFRSLVVITRRGRTTAVTGSPTTRASAEETGACYLVTGSVRRSGSRLRIGAQLVECATGAHLWARNFDGDVAEVFDFQDQISESVATHIEPNVRAVEIARSRRERPHSLAAYDIYLRALPKILSETEPDNAEAWHLLKAALALDPDNGVLLGQAAWVLEHRSTMGWPEQGDNLRALCTDLARRGLDHADGNPDVLSNCGVALMQVAREYDLGMAAILAAVAANPNNLINVTRAGVAHLHCGSLDEALAYFQRANQLNPLDPFAHIWLSGAAHVQVVRGNFSEALDWAAQSYARNTKYDPVLWMLIAANARLDQLAEARLYLRELLRLNPGATIARIRAGQCAKDPTRIEPVLDGLRLAGLPE
jgi:TolB-like protein/Tfp pilus assembly protein PilF